MIRSIALLFLSGCSFSASLVATQSAQAQCAGEWSSRYGTSNLSGVRSLHSMEEGEFGVEAPGGLYISGAEGLHVFDGEVLRRLDEDPLLSFDAPSAPYDSGSGLGLALPRVDRVHFYRDGIWTVLPGVFGNSLLGQIETFQAIVVHDNGNGPELYVGGFFQDIDGVPVRNIARFDGTSWSAVGAGLEGEVEALHAHDFGAGSRLVAGGRFTSTGPQTIGRVAVFDGGQWASVGIAPPDGPVRTLASWNDGLSNRLIAGGRFATADGVSVNSIAAFDAGTWSALGSGIELGPGGVERGVDALIVDAQGSNSKLVAAGRFAGSVGVAAPNLAAFDGTHWSDLSQGLVPAFVSGVDILGRFDFGQGDELVAGGRLFLGTGLSLGLARRQGGTWTRLREEQGTTLPQSVFDLPAILTGVEWDDGQNKNLYIGGFLTGVNGLRTSAVAQRLPDGTWSDVGGGLFEDPFSDPFVGALYAYNGTLRGSSADASGVYALGSFGGSGNGQSFNNVARWDGTQWNRLGNGLAGPAGLVPNPVGGTFGYDLTVFDDGSGPRLFAVGPYSFLPNVAPAPSVHSFAVWDGVAWEPLPTTGIAQGGGVFEFRPASLEVYDDGSGSALYVGGEARIDGGNAEYSPLLRWNGSGFDVFPDIAGGVVSEAFDLEVFDDGSGPKLWIAGRGGPLSSFFAAGGLATWDGANIEAKSSPFGPFGAQALTVLEGDGGPAELLVAGEQFVPGALIPGTAIFGESVIQPFDRVPVELFTADASNGIGRSAYAGGNFKYVDMRQSSGFAERTRACPVGESYCFGEGESSPGCTPCPCGNEAAPGSRGGCINVGGDGARLVVTGNPSASDDTLRFEVRGMAPDTLGVLFSAESRLPRNAANPCFGLDTGIQNSGDMDGLRCIGGATVTRHGGRPSDASGDLGVTTNGWGPPNGPPDGLIAFSGYVAGQTRHFQVFHRDGLASGCRTGINTSQGVTVTFGP